MKITIATIALSLAFFLSFSGKLAIAEDTPDKKAAIDWDKARTLFEKQQSGGKLSDEEQAYLKRAIAEKAAAGGERNAPPADGGRIAPPADAGRGAPAADNPRGRREGDAARDGDAARGGLPADFDTKRFSELQKKLRGGEALTPDEEQFLRRGQEILQSRRQVGGPDGGRVRSRGDSFPEMMFPPELLLKHAADLKLDDAQVKSIQEEVQKAQEKFPEMQRSVGEQVAALGEQMRDEKIDEDKAVAALDKVLNAEREIKRAQLMLIIKVRSQLTAEQQTALRELRTQLQSEIHAAGGRRGEAQPGHGVSEKMQQLQVHIRRMKEAGKDTSSVEEAAQKVMEMMKNGKAQEAEVALDDILKSLDGEGGRK